MATSPGKWRRLGALAALALGIMAPLATADSAAFRGVIVLRNGNVLAGTIGREGDHYRVNVGQASLQVPVAQVDMFCETLEEAYELRRRNRTGASADAHLELARWCLRNDLLDQAAREALDARTVDPGHLGLPALEAQVRQRLELQSAQLEAPSARVQQASAETPLTAPKAPAPGFDVPAVAQSQFIRSIQPMLVHSCATVGCHTRESSLEFQMDRWALGGAGNATLIRRNLAAVVARVNATDPPASELLQRARQSHGRNGEPQSTPLTSFQSAKLLEWLGEATGVKPAPIEPASTPANAAADQTSPLTAEELDGIENPPPTAPQRVANPSRRFVPRDEFDPEIFNRRRASAPPQPARDATAREQASSAIPQPEEQGTPELPTPQEPSSQR